MKIAIVGTESASHGLTPWEDHSWTIWGTSPNSRDYPRVDRQFEVHCFDVMRTYIPASVLTAYHSYLRQHPNVWTLVKSHDLPDARQLDVDAIIDEFGPYFLSSSPSWMLGEALLTPGVEEIGLWGIDCSAKDEYLQQRPGIQFFLWEATKRRIKISAPPESDILRPAPLYGLREFNPQFRKTWAKRQQTQRLLDEAEQRQLLATQQALHYQGELAMIDYYMRTWDNDSR